MKIIMAFVSIAALLLLTGCWPSLHPIYHTEDLVTEPAIIGIWGSDDGAGFYHFTQATENSYNLLYQEEDSTQSEFEVHLIKLDTVLIMDFYPREPDFKTTELYAAHLMPVQLGDSLKWQALEYRFVKSLLKKDPTALKHEREGDYTLLTASTDELQAFVSKHLHNELAWDGPEAGLKKK